MATESTGERYPDGETGRELERLMGKYAQEWKSVTPWSGEPAYPPVVFAAAELFGVDPEAVAWRVEAERGFEPHDHCYTDVVLAEAMKLSAGLRLDLRWPIPEDPASPEPPALDG